MCRIWRPPRNSIFVRSKLLLQVISLWLIFTLRIDVYALRDLMGHCYVHFAFLFTLRETRLHTWRTVSGIRAPNSARSSWTGSRVCAIATWTLSASRSCYNSRTSSSNTVTLEQTKVVHREPVSRSPCALLKLDFLSLADQCIQQMHWLIRSSSFSKAQGLRETGSRTVDITHALLWRKVVRKRAQSAPYCYIPLLELLHST